MNKIIILFVLVVITMSCEKDDFWKYYDSSSSVINGWYLKKVINNTTNETIDVPESIDSMIISFGDENKLLVKSSCNSGGGTFFEKNDSLTFDIGMTDMACAEDLMYWEEIFIESLNKTRKYTMKSGVLRLYTNSEYDLELIPIIEGQAYGASELFGKWKWVSSCGGFTGLCEYADSVDYSIDIEFTYSYNYYQSKNGKPEVHSKFYLRNKFLDSDTLLMLSFDGYNYSHTVEFKDDTLLLEGNMSYKYVKN